MATRMKMRGSPKGARSPKGMKKKNSVTPSFGGTFGVAKDKENGPPAEAQNGPDEENTGFAPVENNQDQEKEGLSPE